MANKVCFGRQAKLLSWGNGALYCIAGRIDHLAGSMSVDLLNTASEVTNYTILIMRISISIALG